MPALLCAGNFRMLPDTAQTSPLFNMFFPQFFKHGKIHRKFRLKAHYDFRETLCFRHFKKVLFEKAETNMVEQESMKLPSPCAH